MPSSPGLPVNGETIQEYEPVASWVFMLFQISSSRHFPSYISWKVSSATSAVDHINIPTYPIGQLVSQQGNRKSSIYIIL